MSTTGLTSTIIIYLLGVLISYVIFYITNRVENGKYTLKDALPSCLFSWVFVIFIIIATPLLYITRILSESSIIEKLDKWFQGKTNESRND